MKGSSLCQINFIMILWQKRYISFISLYITRHICSVVTQNPLCNTKTIIWDRPNLWALPTQAELARGLVRPVNITDPNQTFLPQFDLAHLNVICGGPYQVRLSKAYITSIQVNINYSEMSSHAQI